ncbi:hypothetical protein M427DRAFT_34558 [Gonapodya prolifera JEL478]|uniref:SH3 domain-containing protein n=1 Tax=Gonapodya prolifera (strain JEL478) TaxID=1344416 RepID=A0A139A7F6_GONPJ|nr:hypothetical protein M427DRAFT_34558 [Gonapodya prolifera JEL478]|eukprot:KXS12737.1 hypothetical protein M427DRAFT_34558 [Gonapodya prolifera JEL478]
MDPAFNCIQPSVDTNGNPDLTPGAISSMGNCSRTAAVLNTVTSPGPVIGGAVGGAIGALALLSSAFYLIYRRRKLRSTKNANLVIVPALGRKENSDRKPGSFSDGDAGSLGTDEDIEVHKLPKGTPTETPSFFISPGLSAGVDEEGGARSISIRTATEDQSQRLHRTRVTPSVVRSETDGSITEGSRTGSDFGTGRGGSVRQVKSSLSSGRYTAQTSESRKEGSKLRSSDRLPMGSTASLSQSSRSPIVDATSISLPSVHTTESRSESDAVMSFLGRPALSELLPGHESERFAEYRGDLMDTGQNIDQSTSLNTTQSKQSGTKPALALSPGVSPTADENTDAVSHFTAAPSLLEHINPFYLSLGGSPLSHEPVEVNRVLVASSDYVPTLTDELELAEGSAYYVDLLWADGWCYGRNLSTGIGGYAPIQALQAPAASFVREDNSLPQFTPPLPPSLLPPAPTSFSTNLDTDKGHWGKPRQYQPPSASGAWSKQT